MLLSHLLHIDKGNSGQVTRNRWPFRFQTTPRKVCSAHVWPCDRDLVSKQEVWDQILAYSKPTKEANHMVLFWGCQEKLSALPKAFPTYLLLVLLRDKKERKTLFFPTNTIWLKIQIPLEKSWTWFKSPLRYE